MLFRSMISAVRSEITLRGVDVVDDVGAALGAVANLITLPPFL